MKISILTQSDHQTATGHRLRRLIDMLGMTYVEAAALMGVSKHVLRNWMAGDSYPQPYAVYRLCRGKGVDFNYVFLEDWTALPHRLARVLEAELSAGPAVELVEGKTDGGIDARTIP